MTYRHITVHPVAGALGAEIQGANLAHLTDEVFDEIHAAWLDYQVVFFHDQHITPKQQLALAHRFGDIHHHPFMKSMDDYPDIFEIVKNENDTHTFGATWHSDQMFNPQPAKATILYAKETPDAGGDTLFASMYAAHDALSETLRKTLAGVKTWSIGDRFKHYKGKGRKDRYAGNEKMAGKVKDPGNVITEAAHPLLRTHPESGKKALYIGSHTQTLVDFDNEEAAPILAFLRKHAIRPEFTCRFRWQPGSMAIWDNRCVQHRALGDFTDQRRRMHRITIAGDAPF